MCGTPLESLGLVDGKDSGICAMCRTPLGSSEHGDGKDRGISVLCAGHTRKPWHLEFSGLEDGKDSGISVLCARHTGNPQNSLGTRGIGSVGFHCCIGKNTLGILDTPGIPNSRGFPVGTAHCTEIPLSFPSPWTVGFQCCVRDTLVITRTHFKSL